MASSMALMGLHPGAGGGDLGRDISSGRAAGSRERGMETVRGRNSSSTRERNRALGAGTGGERRPHAPQTHKKTPGHPSWPCVHMAASALYALPTFMARPKGLTGS